MAFYSTVLINFLKSSQKEHIFIKKILKNKKQLHFAVENRVCKSQKDFTDLDEIFNLKLKLESKEKFVFVRSVFCSKKSFKN